MCKIRYIIRKKEEILEDKIIEVVNKDFNLLDKPYYIVKHEFDTKEKFSFSYLDENEKDKVLNDEHFKLTFGIQTGRLKELEINNNTHIKNEYWEIFREHILISTSETIQRNIIHGFDIIKKIYFKQFELSK